MARTNTVVDNAMLETALRETESAGVVKTHKELFTAVANLYSERVQGNATLKTISANIVKNRIELLGLVIALPKGKKGRKTGSTGGGRKSNWQLRAEAKCLSCQKGNAKRAASCGNAKCALHKDWAGLIKIDVPAAPVVADITATPVDAPVVVVEAPAADVPVVAELATA
jgi:hypothetical protein